MASSVVVLPSINLLDLAGSPNSVFNKYIQAWDVDWNYYFNGFSQIILSLETRGHNVSAPFGLLRVNATIIQSPTDSGAFNTSVVDSAVLSENLGITIPLNDQNTKNATVTINNVWNASPRVYLWGETNITGQSSPAIAKIFGAALTIQSAGDQKLFFKPAGCGNEFYGNPGGEV